MKCVNWKILKRSLNAQAISLFPFLSSVCSESCGDHVLEKKQNSPKSQGKKFLFWVESVLPNGCYSYIS